MEKRNAGLATSTYSKEAERKGFVPHITASMNSGLRAPHCGRPERRFANLFALDSRYEAEAYYECRQVLITEYGTRLYALTSPLSYKGRSMVFAVPLRSNIRWDTPTKWYVPTSNRESTRPGNHAGFDCSKMLPVCREVVNAPQQPGSPMPAQYVLAAQYPKLIEKAQAYLLDREIHGAFDSFETDIDAIAKWVLPGFQRAA